MSLQAYTGRLPSPTPTVTKSFSQAAMINKSLSALGNCINALTDRNRGIMHVLPLHETPTLRCPVLLISPQSLPLTEPYLPCGALN